MGISNTAMREIAWRVAAKEKTIPTLLISLEITYWVIILILGFSIIILACLGAEFEPKVFNRINSKCAPFNGC